MSEQTQRGTVIAALRSLDAFSVENRVNPGTPDVNFVEGWIECKWLRRWPRDEEATVRISHFTPQQRAWLRRRWRRGGAAYLLLQVGAHWLLYTGDVAAEHVGRVTKKKLLELAIAQWPRGLNKKEFLAWMSDSLGR